MKTVNLPDITFVWKNQMGNCEKFRLHRFSRHAQCKRVVQHIQEKEQKQARSFCRMVREQVFSSGSQTRCNSGLTILFLYFNGCKKHVKSMLCYLVHF